MTHAQLAEAEVKQRGLGFFDLRQQFRRHSGAVGNARGETGRGRFVPVRQTERLGGIADVLLVKTEFMQRTEDVQFTRSGATGAHIERVIGIHAIEDVLDAILCRVIA